MHPSLLIAGALPRLGIAAAAIGVVWLAIFLAVL